MSLRKLLKSFCIDAYKELKSIGEIPRPPYNSPLIADNIYLTHPLSKLPSYTQLKQYMQSSGLSNKLHDIGHAWFWRYEVFEWLFLERVIAESSGTTLDIDVFNKIFNHAYAELYRNSFRIRRVTVLNGLPKLKSTIELGTGLLLSQVKNSGYDLVRLLESHYSNRNREPSLWVDSDNRLLVQTCAVSKGNRGINLDESLKQLRQQAKFIIKALKLSIDTPVYPKAVYLSYLSSFPLLPILYTEFEEFSGFLFHIERNMTRTETTAIKRNVRFV